MDRAAPLTIATLALVLVAPRASRACEPVRVAVAGPADLGVLPESCEATEASLETRAAALVATSDLYGNLQAGIGARGRVVVAERTWISLWAPSLEYRFAANATVESDRTSLGGGVAGIHHRVPVTDKISIAPFARLLLPTETGFERASRWGGEQGVSASARVHRRVELAFGYAFTLVSTANGGRVFSILTESIAADVVYRPWRAFAVAGGFGLRFALAEAKPFDSFDPRISFRLYPWRGLFVVLSGVAPSFGADRTDLGLALSFGYRG